MKQKVLLILCSLSMLTITAAKAQNRLEQLNSAEILHQLHRLGNTSKVLYLAAHPDDENTRLISWLTNHLHTETAYLSLTRGDGGQNLIGPELREALGVIRTHELMAARRTDGAKQFFTTANDFGYSKSVDETLEIWDEERVLHDMVWVIRNFRPDHIITRFSPEIGPRSTHGHHTASAQLALKAVKMAADPNTFVDQLKRTDVHQVRSVYWNTSWWFYGNEQVFDSLMKQGEVIRLDVGTYNALLGKSYSEIAAEARSQHKSQGFGTAGSRGPINEYLQLLWQADDRENEDLIIGLSANWSALENGKEIQRCYDKLLKNYQAASPESSIPDLLDYRKALQKNSNRYLRKEKTLLCDDLLLQMSGLYLSAWVEEWHAAAGDTLVIKAEAVNRSQNQEFTIVSLQSGKQHILPYPIEGLLKPGDKREEKGVLMVEPDKRPSQPYWLQKVHDMGMYSVDDYNLLGEDFNAPEYAAELLLKYADETIPIQIPVSYRGSDRVKGEVIQPFHIVPDVLVSLDKQVYVFQPNQVQEVRMNARLMGNSLKGYAELNLPEGWIAEPPFYELELNAQNQKQEFVFKVMPPSTAQKAVMGAMVKTSEKIYTMGMQEINYDHIPYTCIFPPASADIIHLDIQVPQVKVAYLQGAGDEVPEALNRMGVECALLTTRDLTKEQLSNYDVLVLGIRAFNTLSDLPLYHNDLMEFVKNGGNLIVQYNTSYGLPSIPLGPYPLTISRDRVTDEQAEVRFINAAHPVLNVPNKIGPEDFNGWVQERGLYFPSKWDEKYQAILEMADPGEEPYQGSLLVAQYGQGYYVYTGLSFFRELPAGVPGAYRLFANLLAL